MSREERKKEITIEHLLRIIDHSHPSVKIIIMKKTYVTDLGNSIIRHSNVFNKNKRKPQLTR